MCNNKCPQVLLARLCLCQAKYGREPWIIYLDQFWFDQTGWNISILHYFCIFILKFGQFKVWKFKFVHKLHHPMGRGGLRHPQHR